MTSVAAQLRTAAGRLFFRQAKVAQHKVLSPSFLKLRLETPSLVRGDLNVGDKVQLLVPELGMRTYTPFELDAAHGVFTILAYLHDDGPGARWLRSATAGVEVLFFGPRRSLSLASVTAPLVVVGDETSVALVASLEQQRKDVRALLEVNDPSETSAVLTTLGATATLVRRAPADGHLPELERSLREALAAQTALVFSGRARTIQALRTALRARPAQHLDQRVKAYWADGKRGID